MALILVVDDEPDMRLALGTVLKRQGHSIVEAGDGESALAEIGKRPVELMLLDIRLPGMDGVQVLKKARASREDLPIVMLTGYGSVDTAVKLIQSGADGYLSKPFSNQRLIETVEKALLVRRLAAEPLHRSLAEKLSPLKVPADKPVEPPALRRGRRSSRWAAGGALALVAAFVLLFWWDPFQWRGVPAQVVALQSPFSNPTGLAWKDGELWAADWLTQSVYRMKAKGNTLEVAATIPLPKTHVTGLAIADGEVYTCDSWRRVIQRRKLDAGFTLLQEFKSPGPNPSGLYWDGRYLWSLDATQGRFYQHDPKTMTVLESYASPGRTPVGLFKGEGYLWSADAVTRRFYKHRMDAQLTVLEQFDLDELNQYSEPLSAFTFERGLWWAGLDGKNTLLRFPMRALHPRS